MLEPSKRCLLFPARITFWRSSRTTLVHHRCPFWAPGVGITPIRTIAIDMLHTFVLGPVLVFCREAIWCVLESGIWANNETTHYEAMLVSVANLKHELFRFYCSWDRTHPADKVTRVSSLTPKMLGVGGKRACKTKAMESWGILLFLVDLFGNNVGRLGPSAPTFLDAGRLLQDFLATLKRCGPAVRVRDQQMLMDIWKQFMVKATILGVSAPKFHLMFHMILRIDFIGNLKKTLVFVHQANFERLGRVKVQEAIRRTSVRQRLA